MASADEIAGTLALTAYRSFGRLVTPAAGWLLDRRQRRGKEDAERRGERLGVASRPRPAGALVWVHAASVGETNAVLPLIRRLAAAGCMPLLTSGTVTSAQVAAERLGAPAIHQYAPLDLPRFVGRFLDHWRPDLAILVESELWPGTILAASGRGIPLVLVNGRMSERSFRRWRRAAWLSRAVLAPLELCLVQTEADAKRFSALGARAVAVAGNLKLDAAPPEADPAALAAVQAVVGTRPVFLAASTHAGEEEAVLRALPALQVAVPGLLTIIAPRHPDRGGEVAALAARQGLSVARRAAGEAVGGGTQVYVADTIGEMGVWYRLATVAFLGGSLIRHGGQNPIEAVKLGTALVHGPHVENFAEIYAALDEAGAVAAVADAEGLAAAAGRLLTEAGERERMTLAAAACVARFAGALDRTWERLGPFLPQQARDA
ncbi:MAG TPA: 3-deoxy-D-manno-octulosonic acid transferase [Afifellaceae bacterium]|nr:3-deoxy-D-manno-octulosonic acid transferase [Afifellaceae bacterium]